MENLKLGIAMMVVVCVALSGINGVKAWGVAYGEKTINLEAGDTYQIRTSLQNMVGDDEVKVYIKLEGDNDIAELSETEVTLPPKTRSHPVYITVDVPEDPKDRYSINAVYTKGSNGGVMVDMATQKLLTFTINVNKEEPPPNPPSDDGNGGDWSSPSPTPPDDDDDTENIDDSNDISDEGEEKQEDNMPERVENIDRSELNATSETDTNQESSGGWLMWLIAIPLIIGAIGYLWWEGWI